MAETDEALPLAWVRCRGWIEAARAVADPMTSLKEVSRRVFAGQAQLWPGARCAAVTQIIDYDTARAFNFWLCGGRLAELRPMLPEMEAFARGQGCTHAYFTGREAWWPVLEPLGFTRGHVIFEKEL